MTDDPVGVVFVLVCLISIVSTIVSCWLYDRGQAEGESE